LCPTAYLHISVELLAYKVRNEMGAPFYFEGGIGLLIASAHILDMLAFAFSGKSSSKAIPMYFSRS